MAETPDAVVAGSFSFTSGITARYAIDFEDRNAQQLLINSSALSVFLPDGTPTDISEVPGENGPGLNGAYRTTFNLIGSLTSQLVGGLYYGIITMVLIDTQLRRVRTSLTVQDLPQVGGQ